MVSTKGANLTLRIGYDIINTILLLYFIVFYCILLYFIVVYLRYSGRCYRFYLLRNSYGILCKIFYFLCSFNCCCFVTYLRRSIFCKNFTPSSDICSAEEARMGETSLHLKTNEKSSHLLLFIQSMIL